jgi:hypothetical protein
MGEQIKSRVFQTVKLIHIVRKGQKVVKFSNFSINLNNFNISRSPEQSQIYFSIELAFFRHRLSPSEKQQHKIPNFNFISMLTYLVEQAANF